MTMIEQCIHKPAESRRSENVGDHVARGGGTRETRDLRSQRQHLMAEGVDLALEVAHRLRVGALLQPSVLDLDGALEQAILGLEAVAVGLRLLQLRGERFNRLHKLELQRAERGGALWCLSAVG